RRIHCYVNISDQFAHPTTDPREEDLEAGAIGLLAELVEGFLLALLVLLPLLLGPGLPILRGHVVLGQPPHRSRALTLALLAAIGPEARGSLLTIRLSLLLGGLATPPGLFPMLARLLLLLRPLLHLGGMGGPLPSLPGLLLLPLGLLQVGLVNLVHP